MEFNVQITERMQEILCKYMCPDLQKESYTGNYKYLEIPI